MIGLLSRVPSTLELCLFLNGVLEGTWVWDRCRDVGFVHGARPSSKIVSAAAKISVSRTCGDIIPPLGTTEMLSQGWNAECSKQTRKPRAVSHGCARPAETRSTYHLSPTPERRNLPCEISDVAFPTP